MSDADHWVYICRDTDDLVLYVGITCEGIDRFRRGHSKTAVWWPEVASIQVEHFESRDETLARERFLIDTLKPVHNVAAVELEGGVPDRDSLPTNWLKIGQLAGWLDVGIDDVVEWMDDGMPHMLLGGTPRFRASAVRDWLARRAT